MKPKHKHLLNIYSQTQAPPQYTSCKHIAKKSSMNSTNHLPISNNYTISVKKQAKRDEIYESCTKPITHKLRQSPYVHLPSVGQDENVNWSNVSDRYGEGGMEGESIYEKLRLDERQKRPFETEQSQLSNYYGEDGEYNNRKNTKNSHLETRRKQSAQIYSANQQSQSFNASHSRSQSRCIHKSPNFTKKSNQHHDYNQDNYYSVKHNNNEDIQPLYTLNRSQQLIKKQINQKLDRVCEKIGNLSREKEREYSNNGKGRRGQEERAEQQGASISWQNHQHNQSSTLEIYQDNRIQHRIVSPPKPTHQQFLQSRIIQMDKKIIFANAKIIKLEEQLLTEKEKLIKKEKEWLLRENQLLNYIQDHQLEEEMSQQKNNSSFQKSRIHKAHNIVVNDTQPNEFVLENQLREYKQLFDSLFQLLSEMTKVLKINDNWLNLMNRTLSHQLPGTAFRVKEQMNLYHNFFVKIEKQCQLKLSDLLRVNETTKSSPVISQHQSPTQTSFNISNNPSLNQSQAFLLQSYCPPISQQFQIQTTKRNSSILKPQQKKRKSISCLSESKSIISTNKKYPSTHKKSVKKQTHLIEASKVNEKPHHSLYHSRKSQYYCDEVFYSRAKQINTQSPKENEGKTLENSEHTDNQLYYLLSLQALTIETLIPQQLSVESTVDQDNQENLLAGMDS